MNDDNEPAPVALVVDDDEMTRVLVAATLEPEGFRVEEAASGEEAVEAFQRVNPDIVLLDVNMPGMGGFECCERLRRLPQGQHVPILVLTGNDDDASISRAYAAGATDFGAKPMRWKVLGHRARFLLRASRALEDLARSEASLSCAQAIAHVGNWEWRPGNALAYWSAELYGILGLDAERDPPNLDTLLKRVPEDQRPQVVRAFANLLKHGTRYSLEHRIVRADGSERIVFQEVEALQDGQGRTVLVRGTLQDITERKQTEEHIHTLAYVDGLTGLPNHLQFKEQLERSLRQCAREHTMLAVLFLDLDRFSQVNDALGHQVGDQLLRLIAERLSRCARGGDCIGRQAGDAATARLGGDEFTVTLAGLSQPEDAAKVAQRIVDVLAPSFPIDGQELFVSASIGIAVFPSDGRDMDSLLRNADAAMYAAKSLGGNRFRFYAQEMNEHARARLALEADLHRALERGELLLHFQPKVSLSSGELTGAEALVRWRHPERGLVPPGEFIPLAEETGLILPLGEWVIESVCEQMRAWLDAGLSVPPVALNLSARQFRQEKLARVIAQSLRLNGIEAMLLDLEITESALMHDVEAAVATLRELKAVGVKLSLDDFGTGYSSLNYLKRFPIDRIKIDQSFVRDITTEPDDAAICIAVIGLAHSLKLAVVAEGVETEGQMNYLRQHHCDEMQGYYFSRPLPPEDFAQLLADRKTLELPVLPENRRKTLLVVDDEANIRSALTRVLRRDGYQILAAESARDGFDLLATHDVQVILSDQRMPEMNGTEFLSRVRDLYPNTIRIVLSGYTDFDSITESINRGAIYRFLTKPWEDELLRQHIREAFRHYDAARGEVSASA